MTQKHTPTPWQDDKDGDIVCPDQNYELIAHAFDMYGDSIDAKTNAAFIVRACNSHDVMVDALQYAKLALLCAGHKDIPEDSAIAKINLALSKGE